MATRLRKVLRFSHAMKAALTVALIFLMLGGGIAGDFFIAEYVAQRSAHQLCNIINLETKVPISKPVDPKANPSREQNYEGYIAFLGAKRAYKC